MFYNVFDYIRSLFYARPEKKSFETGLELLVANPGSLPLSLKDYPSIIGMCAAISLNLNWLETAYATNLAIRRATKGPEHEFVVATVMFQQLGRPFKLKFERVYEHSSDPADPRNGAHPLQFPDSSLGLGPCQCAKLPKSLRIVDGASLSSDSAKAPSGSSGIRAADVPLAPVPSYVYGGQFGKSLTPRDGVGTHMTDRDSIEVAAFSPSYRVPILDLACLASAVSDESIHDFYPSPLTQSSYFALLLFMSTHDVFGSKDLNVELGSKLLEMAHKCEEKESGIFRVVSEVIGAHSSKRDIVKKTWPDIRTRIMKEINQRIAGMVGSATSSGDGDNF